MFVHTESVREEIITQNIKKTKMIHTHTNIYIYIYEYIEKIKLGGKKGSIWTFDMRGDTHERIHHHRVNTKQFPSFNCKHKDQFGFLPLLLFLFFFLFWPAFCLDLLPEIWYKSDRNDSLFGRERERERERERKRERKGKWEERKMKWRPFELMAARWFIRSFWALIKRNDEFRGNWWNLHQRLLIGGRARANG